jgi:hypothetical protein
MELYVCFSLHDLVVLLMLNLIRVIDTLVHFLFKIEKYSQSMMNT